MALHRALPGLAQRLGRAPRPSEIAAGLGLSIDDVIDTLVAIEPRSARSLHAPDPSREPGHALTDRIGVVDPRRELAGCRGPLRHMIEQLPARERAILTMRFFDGRKQSEIAVRIGVSQMHVDVVDGRRPRRCGHARLLGGLPTACDDHGSMSSGPGSRPPGVV